MIAHLAVLYLAHSIPFATKVAARNFETELDREIVRQIARLSVLVRRREEPRARKRTFPD